jgi:hypothetical protein
MELLITVAALFAAIYAAVPRDRQLNLLLRIGVFDWTVVLCASLLVLYLEFNEFCSVKGWVLSRPWPKGITRLTQSRHQQLRLHQFLSLYSCIATKKRHPIGCISDHISDSFHCHDQFASSEL